MPRGGYRLVKWCADKDTALRKHPVQLTLAPNTELVGDLRESVWYPLFRYGHYPHQLADDQYALSLIEPGGVVWDVGANIGYTAALYAEKVGKSGSVYCFEPSPRAYAGLEENASRITGADLKTFNIAISDSVSTVRFVERDFLDLSSVATANDDDWIEVQAMSLDQAFEKYELKPPSLIKIDVEGHEETVIRGSSFLIATYKPIIEFEALTTNLRYELIDLLQQVSNDGYRFLAKDENNTYLEIAPKSRETYGKNIIASPKMP